MPIDRYADAQGKIDFVFPLFPLWVTYSGLPQKLGATSWCVFRRLLELRYRFGSTNFFYSLKKLCATTGIIEKNNVRKILDRLVDEKLISYKTFAGRGKAAEFHIIEPLNAPLTEEKVYEFHPRLRSKSYRAMVIRENGKKVLQQHLLEKEEKKVSEEHLLENKKVSEKHLLENKKVSEEHLLEAKKVSLRHPNKKDIYKKDNNNKKDLSHEKEKNPSEDKDEDTPAAVGKKEKKTDRVVVVINLNKLKEYGISGDDAEKFLKKFSQAYLAEKIEILEFKRENGDEIRNIGAMLRKAITEDWQPPPGFNTRAQREQEARKRKEAEELAAREAKEKEEREKRECEQGKIVEEWRKIASPEELKSVKERARRELLAEFPEGDERWLGPLVRIREERIIAEEYAIDKNKVRRES
jgi:hypothetical protein